MCLQVFTLLPVQYVTGVVIAQINLVNAASVKPLKASARLANELKRHSSKLSLMDPLFVVKHFNCHLYGVCTDDSQTTA